MLIGDSRMTTAAASTDTVCEKPGRAWIWVEDDASPTLDEAVVRTKLTLVNELIDASTLQTSDAEQVTQKANQKYPKYLWRAVPARRTGEFVVQGDLRANPSRPSH